MAFSLVTPLRLSNGSLGASPGGDGGREAGGDRALHRATSAVIGSCLVGLQQLRRHADRVIRISSGSLAECPLSRTAGFTPVPFNRLGLAGPGRGQISRIPNGLGTRSNWFR